MAHRLSHRARADLDDIWDYIVANGGSLEIADRQIDSRTARFYLLASHPRIGRSRDDLGAGLRSFPVGDYVIVYSIAGTEVTFSAWRTVGATSRRCSGRKRRKAVSPFGQIERPSAN